MITFELSYDKLTIYKRLDDNVMTSCAIYLIPVSSENVNTIEFPYHLFFRDRIFRVSFL